MIHAGELRDLISIEQQVAGQDGFGQDNGSWTAFATTWAKIEPLSGLELYQSRAGRDVISEVTRKLTMRFVDGVTAKMRIRFGERVLNIQSILNVDERREILVILATERA